MVETAAGVGAMGAVAAAVAATELNRWAGTVCPGRNGIFLMSIT